MAPAAISVRLFLTFIALFQYLNTVNCQCYDFGGNIAVNDSACYHDRDHSFCCDKDWTCLSTGICSRENSTEIIPKGGSPLHRATCTDMTWRSKQCPQFCTNQTGHRGMKQCDESYSTFCCVWTDCCGGPNGRQCLEEGTPCLPQSSGFVNLFEKAVPLTTIGKTRSAQSSASTSNSVSTTPVSSITLTSETATGTSQSDPVVTSSPKRSSSTGIIAGVAVAAVVSLTGAALALLWWKRRRAHVKNNQSGNQQEPLTQSDHPQDQGTEPTNRSRLGFAPSELPSPGINWQNPQSTHLAEAPSSEKGPAELPTKSFDAPELLGSEMNKR